MILLRVIFYLLGAALLGMLGTVRASHIHRAMYFSWALFLLIAAITAVFTNLGFTWTRWVIDWVLSPALVWAVIATAGNFLSVRKQL